MAESQETYLYLEQIIAADPLIVHLVICIVRITAALVLDESKKSARRSTRCWDIAPNEASISVKVLISSGYVME
jgi:hypothetical protein